MPIVGWESRMSQVLRRMLSCSATAIAAFLMFATLAPLCRAQNIVLMRGTREFVNWCTLFGLNTSDINGMFTCSGVIMSQANVTAGIGLAGFGDKGCRDLVAMELNDNREANDALIVKRVLLWLRANADSLSNDRIKDINAALGALYGCQPRNTVQR